MVRSLFLVIGFLFITESMTYPQGPPDGVVPQGPPPGVIPSGDQYGGPPPGVVPGTPPGVDIPAVECPKPSTISNFEKERVNIFVY